MKIIPVIDVLNSIAVHGIQGKRKNYHPLNSLLCASVDPLIIAKTFESFGFEYLYLADLDAIMGKSPNLEKYRLITKNTNLHLMVDAGIADVSRAKDVLNTGVKRIVIGSETLKSLDFVSQAARALGKDVIIVSIDLKHGRILSSSKDIASMDVISFLEQLIRIGVDQIILLDLDRVGTQQGINFSFLKKLLRKSEARIIVGGGIKNLFELEKLENLGISGALVATVLHNGKVTINELKVVGFL